MEENTKQKPIVKIMEDQKAALITELAKVSEYTLGKATPCAENYGYFKPKGM